MSMVRNFAYDPDRTVRRAAYEAELEGWKKAVVPLAAALNGIKGQVNTLARRRGWATPLEASLFDSNIDRETLEVMLTAARESFVDFRRYLRAKARVLGLERLAWYDIFAPVGKEKQAWEFEQAQLRSFLSQIHWLSVKNLSIGFLHTIRRLVRGNESKGRGGEITEVKLKG